MLNTKAAPPKATAATIPPITSFFILLSPFALLCNGNQGRLT